MIIPINIVANRKNTSTKAKLAGNIGENEVTTLSFTFSNDWEGTTKTIVFKTPAGELKLPSSLESDDTYPVDGTLFDAVGTLYYTVYGSYGDGRVINASGEILVGEALSNTGGLTITEFTDIISECITAKLSTEQATTDALAAIEDVRTAIPTATAQAQADAEEQAGIATVKATAATQALSDLIAMLGSQVATLDANGHLTAAQIPPVSINDTFPVANTAEMLLLTAQRGDVAIIVANDVVTDSYILAADDATVLSNWKKLGVSYVSEAGHAMSADAATDASMINGHRLITMTASQYAVAVIDPDTYYIVTP